MRRRPTFLFAAFALVALAAALLVPEGAPDVTPPGGHRPFVWAREDLFTRLEREFDAAVARGCEAMGPEIDAGLSTLDEALARAQAAPLAPDAPPLEAVTDRLFEVAPRFGACPRRVPELIERASLARRVVKDQSLRWDMGERRSRDALYRILYGSRAAVEELLLQMPEGEAPGLVLGVDEPSSAPSVSFHGVTLRSGDVLLSRGGAPTSAMIARGNDYPGNFSHVALLHVSEAGVPTIVESHIESGVGARPAERYLEDTMLRIMVLRLRADHPRVSRDPALPHRVATAALESAEHRHVPYDFAMDYLDPSKQFCSEVASANYRDQRVRLWRGLSSMSGAGLTRWLSRVGVRFFETHAPSDLEYDPQMRVVAEWRDPDALFADHLDNAIFDVLLEGAEAGDPLDYDYGRLPVARLAKAYSLVLNAFGGVGPVPEGMTATTGLRIETLRQRHAAMHAGLGRRVQAYRAERGRRPPYWTLVRLAREAKRALPAP